MQQVGETRASPEDTISGTSSLLPLQHLFLLRNLFRQQLGSTLHCERIHSPLMENGDGRIVSPGCCRNVVIVGIAFSKAGLLVMGIHDALQDIHFDQGSMVNEKAQLDDRSDYDKVFSVDGGTHGVFNICTKCMLIQLSSPCPRY